MYKVLIAEDDEKWQDLLSEAFEYAGYQVLIAPTGSRALELLDSKEPDMLILDIRMPDLNGLEVLKRLGAQETVRFDNSLADRVNTRLEAADMSPLTPEQLDKFEGEQAYIPRVLNFVGTTHHIPIVIYTDMYTSTALSSYEYWLLEASGHTNIRVLSKNQRPKEVVDAANELLAR